MRSTLGLVMVVACLSGCAAVVVGGGVGGGVIAQDRRTTGSLIEDQAIEWKARSALYQNAEVNEAVHVNFTSFNRVLLVTGEAPTEELRTRVHEIVRDIPNVRRVHNELSLAEPSSALARTSDTYITTKVKTGMLAEPRINPLRVKVVTESGSVFLLGLVTPDEADIATDIARNTQGVQRVVKVFETMGP